MMLNLVHLSTLVLYFPQNGVSTTSLTSANGPIDTFTGRGDGGVSQEASGGKAVPPISSSGGQGGQRKKVSAPGNMQPHIVSWFQWTSSGLWNNITR